MSWATISKEKKLEYLNKRRTKFRNDTRTKLKNIWYGMLWRCHKEQHPAYKDYGLRGITVCERWHNFDLFIKDMGASYKEGLCLERIDNDRGYSPQNCKWATRREQANNRRSNTMFTLYGKTKTLAQWIEWSGIKSSTVRQRFYGLKWTIQDSLTKEVHYRRP